MLTPEHAHQQNICNFTLAAINLSLLSPKQQPFKSLGKHYYIGITSGILYLAFLGSNLSV
jgi:hypothetical protein